MPRFVPHHLGTAVPLSCVFFVHTGGISLISGKVQEIWQVGVDGQSKLDIITCPGQAVAFHKVKTKLGFVLWQFGGDLYRNSF